MILTAVREKTNDTIAEQLEKKNEVIVRCENISNKALYYTEVFTTVGTLYGGYKIS